MEILEVLLAAAADWKRVESPAGLPGVLPDVARPEATHEEIAVQAQSIVDGGLHTPRSKAA